MSFHYLDPSAWVKRHFQEQGSDIVNALFDADTDFACSRLGLLEATAAILRKSRQLSLDESQLGSLNRARRFRCIRESST
jgi:predicted nucleic acid-binding protein